jgi:hypothetical protein
MQELPEKRQVELFLRADSPLLGLVEAHLRDQRRQLLDRFPSQRSGEELLRLQAQIGLLDLLVEGLREDLKCFALTIYD